MAFDVLTTSGINNLVNKFRISESDKRINPLNTRKTRYQNLDTAYSTLSSKLSALKSIISELKESGISSSFAAKASSSSNTNFVSVSASNTAVNNSHSIRVNQLAKSDIVLSQDLSSSSNSTAITSPGSHQFVIATGDGEGGQFTSKATVTFETSDFTDGAISNKKVMEKIQSAINSDKAVVASNFVSGSTTSSGSFILNLNGTETTINYSAGTYNDVIENIIAQINQLSGMTAEKVVDGSNYQIKITVNDLSKYITISGDTGTLLSELSLLAEKEKAASGIVTASTFSPEASTTQLSLTAKNSGYDNRILSLSDSAGSSALNAVGLNLGGARQSFVQQTGTDTAGYVYSTSLLNSKFEFNGINLERNSNVISDLVTGATVTLKSSMQPTDTSVNLTISSDTAKIKEKIKDFITKFNDVYTFIKERSKTVDKNRGLFIGDASSSSLLSVLSSSAYTRVAGIPENQINNLSKLGITFNSTSGLNLTDSARLDSAISENIGQAEALFNSTNGIANVLYDRIDPYLGSNGYLAKSRAAFGKSITSLNDSVASEQTRIEKNAELLRNRYIKLQTQLATLLSNQSYFSTGSSGYFNQ